MVKLGLEILNITGLAAVVAIPFVSIKANKIITSIIFSLLLAISIAISVMVFYNGPQIITYSGNNITGLITLKADYLSAWFISIIAFIITIGFFYSKGYLKSYSERTSEIKFHYIALILGFLSLIDICVIQNSLIFLFAWEVMTISVTILVIFESHKSEVLRAGMYYFIMSHIGLLMLFIAFLWGKVNTGSFDFETMANYLLSQPNSTKLIIYGLFFIGFGIKAGIFPFHVWLPVAHPAAPAHISGIMSGVVIKIGIFGIIRMLFLVRPDFCVTGYIILFLSLISGLYGVMLAIVQHNLKKMLAYHSIENIGLIGIGIGIGSLGIAYNMPILFVLGFSGALLHVWNHALFKSLLFFSSGNIYHAAHSMNIDRLGGLNKHIPRTSILFMIGAIAICGIPPFNGFVSEFMMYVGLYNGLQGTSLVLAFWALFSIIVIALIGGLALLCFTKATGIIFLGNKRDKTLGYQGTDKGYMTIPLFFIAMAIIAIGFAPFLLNKPLFALISSLKIPSAHFVVYQAEIYTYLHQATQIGWFSICFILIIATVFIIRKAFVINKTNKEDQTWGCGYTGETLAMQYSGSSFVREYRKLAEFIFKIIKKKRAAKGLYPSRIEHSTHILDYIEIWLIDNPIRLLRLTMNQFTFLQNGNIQVYLIYGLVFILIILIYTSINQNIDTLLNFLKTKAL
jgi:formate hydrogenlyase subunit 3/multisubunit Na+/H+ antiporter MnhD subunit